jgi:hypothetical protein
MVDPSGHTRMRLFPALSTLPVTVCCRPGPRSKDDSTFKESLRRQLSGTAAGVVAKGQDLSRAPYATHCDRSTSGAAPSIGATRRTQHRCCAMSRQQRRHWAWPVTRGSRGLSLLRPTGGYGWIVGLVRRLDANHSQIGRYRSMIIRPSPCRETDGL